MEFLTGKGAMRPKSGVQNASLAGHRQLIETKLSIFDIFGYVVRNKKPFLTLLLSKLRSPKILLESIQLRLG